MTSLWTLFTSPNLAAARVLPLVLDAAVKGAVVIAAAGLVVALLRRSSAASRHALWAGAICAQLAIPLFGYLLPSVHVPLVERPRWSAATVTMPPESFRVVDVPEFSPSDWPRSKRLNGRMATVIDAPRAALAARSAYATTRGPRFAPRAARPRLAMMPPRRWLREVTRPLSAFLDRTIPPTWVRGLAALWLLGCLGVLARFAAGTIAVARLARRSDRVADGDWLSLTQRIAGALGIARPLTLLRGERFGIPVTWGIVYPVVLLPRSADEWQEERRRFVLLHEIAHIRRLDALTQLIAQFAIAIFW